MNLKKLTEQGELAREKNQDAKALSLLDQAILEAGRKKDYASLLLALSHKLLVWKHAYLKTRDQAFLELMLGEARSGLIIAKNTQVEKGLQAIFLLRIGHCFQYRNNYKLAEHYTKQAVQLISKKDQAKYAEYLGHYGLSQSLAKDKKGLDSLKQALKIIEKAKKVRPFHKLVIHSGLLLRTAIALKKFGKKQETEDMLFAATEISKILAKKYKMPMRLYQIQEIKNKKLIVF